MFHANFCGFNVNESDYFKIYRPSGTNDYLFILVLAPTRFYFNDQEVIATPGSCVFYTPKSTHNYCAIKEFSNSYVHFTSDVNDLDKYSFPVNYIIHPANTYEINSLIQKIRTEYLTRPRNYLIQIDAYITQMLVHIDRSYLQKTIHPNISSAIFSDFQALRLQMLSHCEDDWSIERMCRIVKLEKSQLYSYYKMLYHNSPKAELINSRIEKSKYLLTNENMKVSEVAKACGFDNVYHFTRYFKNTCKCTPSEFINNIQ